MDDYFEDELFQEAVSNGIIDVSVLKTQLEELKRKKYLSQHPYKIWKSKDGFWRTHIIDENGNRQVRKRTTQEDLENYLIQYYKSQEEIILIADVFKEWSDRKLRFGEIEKQSYDKYCTEFHRFFKSTDSICRKKFCNITEMDLEDFIKAKICDMGLTRKTYSNLSLLINGMFKYGKKISVKI